MNPYLERADLWQDFHTRFLADMADALATQVRQNYLVHIEDYVFIRELPRELWRPIGRPDIALARRPDAPGGVATATIETGEEVELMVSIDEVTQRYLEIRDRRSREVVTVIELLSPSNKAAGLDREQYLNKRIRILAGAANLVEIDLLRGAPRLPLGEPAPSCDYCVLVSRARRRPKATLFRIGLRDRLPTVAIPLKSEDADAQLDLQAILNRVYDSATYEAEIYATPPEPPLIADDAAWAAQFVPASQNP
jgi:hypothetical protein